MSLLHMSITIRPVLENLHTEPTNMGVAVRALHMIAPMIFLDTNLTFWAVPDIMFFLVLSKCFRAFRTQVLVLLAAHAIMTDHMARSANRGQAR